MKKIITILTICILFFGINNIFAQEADDDSLPYLTDEDMEAIELVLPFDDSPMSLLDDSRAAVEEPEAITETKDSKENEMPRLNSSIPIYHLLILDRVHAPSADINVSDNITVIYKFLHGRDGYLIAIYKSSDAGPIYPILPIGSRVLVNFTSVQKMAIQDYVNSSAFRKFVTHRTVTAQLRDVFNSNW